MMITLHKREGDFCRRPGESFSPGKGWAKPYNTILWGAKAWHGTSKSCQALQQQINIFSCFCWKKRKPKNTSKAARKGQGQWENNVSCTETAQFYTNLVKQSTRHSGGPTFHPTGLLQECVCSAMPFDKGEDAATCPHLSEPIFWPRFMSKTRTSHCCVLILVYSKASQPSGFKEKR